MTTTKNTEALVHLDFLDRERARIETEMGRTVWDARRAGHSWATIGHYIGISKQAAQKKYGNLECYCGCGGLEADCTTPVPEGPARDLTPAEEEREALGEWAWTFTAEEEAKGRAALATLQAVAASQDAAAAADEYGTTPVDLAPPANRWDGAADSLGRPVYWLEGAADATAQPGTGVGDHNCPRCQSTNHKGGAWHTVAAFKECEPTRFDPQNIVDWFYRGLGVRKSK